MMKFSLQRVFVGALSALMVFSAVPVAAASVSDNVSGRILLQVEGRGEAWYVHPVTKRRHLLGRPDDAFRVMREQGLGISNADLAKIPEAGTPTTGDRALRQRLSGRILLQVESHGEAWYVNPVDQKRYFLGRPADAFRVMREQGLGISNRDLGTIQEQGGTTTTPTSPTNPAPTPGSSANDQKREKLLSYINQERAALGLGALKLHAKLNAGAQAQADDMQRQNYFSTVSPDGKDYHDFVLEAGYYDYRKGVNFVHGSTTVDTMVARWKSEALPGYFHLTIPEYRDLGVGFSTQGGMPVYVVYFGTDLQELASELPDITEMRKQMLARVNQERQKAGVPALVFNDELNQASQAHADDMFTRSYYAHENDAPPKPDAEPRTSPIRRHSENIAQGQYTVQQVMDGWMESSGHRRNILNPEATEAGFGLAFGINENGYQILWVQRFGLPGFIEPF
ncbi:MAG: hypothetical protein HY461_01730 [Parcubacteria group bacterium]|nr:hypothetical protein [Parcubacteria group bacterium]